MDSHVSRRGPLTPAGRRKQRVAEVFELVVELAGAEQAVALAHACAGDEALRREVSLLLGIDRENEAGWRDISPGERGVGGAEDGIVVAPLADDETRIGRRRRPTASAAVLDENASRGPVEGAKPPSGPESALAETMPPALPPASPRPGQRLGRYFLEEAIGEGGMGVVYAARCELGRPVVIKVLRETSGELVARFFREAEILARIRHPGVVRVLEMSRHPTGGFFIVMERLEGESLRCRLERGQLPVARALTFACQIARALDDVHALGIVHRDLKPDNLFVVPDPEVVGEERVKILDFGIAKLSDVPADLATQSNLVFGTPPYMAPEQFEGSARVDARTDLYALGVVLFEMLCGRRPFDCDSFHAFMRAHLCAAPPSVRRFAAVSPALAGVVARLLAKQPEERFASADALVRALVAFAAPDSPAAKRATTARGEARRRAPGRGTRRWSMALALGGALLVGFAPAPLAPGAVPPGGGQRMALALEPQVAQRRDKALRAELASLFDAASDAVQTELLFAIRDVASAETVWLLDRALSEGSPAVRSEATEVLRALAWPEMREALRASLRGAGDLLRVQTLCALLRLGDGEVIDALVEIAAAEPSRGDDGRRRWRLMAAEALARDGALSSSTFPERVRMVLEHESQRTASVPGTLPWRRALRGLLGLGDEVAQSALRRELARSEPERALAAAEILAEDGDTEALAYLKRVVAKRGYPARSQAALVLARHGHAAEEVLEYAETALRSSDPEVVRAAVVLIGRLADAGGVRFADDLEALMRDDDGVFGRNVRNSARVSLLALYHELETRK